MGFLMKRVGLVPASFIVSFVIVTHGSTCDQPTSPHGSVIIHPTQREKYQNGQVILFGCKRGFYLDGMPIITCNGKKWTQTQFRCLGFCPEVRSILNGKVSHVTPQVGKAAIEFRCANNSFQLIGRKRLECIDGRWNGKLPYCHKLLSCVRLQSPANGIVHGNDNSHSAEAKFTCFTGFDLFGASTLICNRGVWSFRVPTCKAYCTKIRDLPNGHVFGTRFSHGQVVSFNCKHGYELVGDRSLRCINGGWNSSVPQCKVMQCAKPSIPSNSRIIYPRTDQVRYTHGTTLYLACNQGHLLAGSPIMVCNYTTWLKREFKCIASCPILGPIRNGVITYVTRKGGGEAEIKCHANYTLSRSSRLSCINGEWNSSIPSCKASCARPSIPVNGKIVGNFFSHGKSVLFYCSFGYAKVGACSIMCDDGKWDKPSPVCKGICSTPSDPRNGKLGQKVSLDKRFLDGDEATFSCNRGYDLIGKKKLRCVGKVWDFREPECKVANCGSLQKPDHGDIIEQVAFSYGNRIVFDCTETGYEMKGSRVRTCQSDGTWSGSPTTCEIVQCGDPGTPQNGKQMVTKGFVYGGSVELKCNRGYTLVGTRISYCRTNQQWSAAVPQCRASCQDPGNLLHGYKIGDNFSHGQKVSYSCNRNFVLEGTQTSTCSDGRWSNKMPSCRAPCAKPAAPLNGGLWGRDFRHGQSVKFICRSGYQRVGTSPITCNDGKWNKPFPVCKARCRFSGKPRDGYVIKGPLVIGEMLKHGEKITYDCFISYTMEGSSTQECDNGRWTSDVPKCKASCVRPWSIRNGRVSGKDFGHGKTVSYRCDGNYALEGRSTLTCDDGRWNSNPPGCRASCSDPGYIDRGNRSGRDFSHGKVVTYECTNQTYSLVGNPRLTCLDGKWDSVRPSCQSLCNKPGILKNGRVIGRNYSDGSVIKFECNKGYKVRGLPFSTCRRGSWEGQFPECEICVQIGAIFWGLWAWSKGANNYYQANITRITPTHLDFALVYDRRKKRSYPRTKEVLIIDKVPSIGDVSPNSPVIANQFSDRDKWWYRTGYVTRTSGDSLVFVRFDNGKEKVVPLERVRLVSRPPFCSDVK